MRDAIPKFFGALAILVVLFSLSTYGSASSVTAVTQDWTYRNSQICYAFPNGTTQCFSQGTLHQVVDDSYTRPQRLWSSYQAGQQMGEGIGALIGVLIAKWMAHRAEVRAQNEAVYQQIVDYFGAEETLIQENISSLTEDTFLEQQLTPLVPEHGEALQQQQAQTQDMVNKWTKYSSDEKALLYKLSREKKSKTLDFALNAPTGIKARYEQQRTVTSREYVVNQFLKALLESYRQQQNSPVMSPGIALAVLEPSKNSATAQSVYPQTGGNKEEFGSAKDNTLTVAMQNIGKQLRECPPDVWAISSGKSGKKTVWTKLWQGPPEDFTFTPESATSFSIEFSTPMHGTWPLKTEQAARESWMDAGIAQIGPPWRYKHRYSLTESGAELRESLLYNDKRQRWELETAPSSTLCWNRTGVQPLPVTQPERAASTGSRQLSIGEGTASISSEPESADIFVDSVGKGHTPAVLNLPSGRHSVQLVMQGYKDWVSDVIVEANSRVNLTASFEPLVSSRTAQSAGPSVDVTTDKQETGTFAERWVTGEQIFPLCDQRDDSICVGYVAGVADALGITGHLEATTDRGICIPQGVTTIELKETAKNYITQHPDQRMLSAALLVQSALREKWPCKP